MRTIQLLTWKEPGLAGPDVSWAGLSRALASALDGDAPWFAWPPAEFVQDELAARLAIGCMEYVPQVNTWAEMWQRIQMGRQLAPHLQGAAEVWQVARAATDQYLVRPQAPADRLCEG